MLDEMRRIDIAAARGDVSPEAAKAAKARLVGQIEDAPISGDTLARSAEPHTGVVWHVVVFALCLLAGATAVATVLLGDLTLALTCTLTLLAAFTVHAFRTLDD
jgi:hypothetical protein